MEMCVSQYQSPAPSRQLNRRGMGKLTSSVSVDPFEGDPFGCSPKEAIQSYAQEELTRGRPISSSQTTRRMPAVGRLTLPPVADSSSDEEQEGEDDERKVKSTIKKPDDFPEGLWCAIANYYSEDA